MVSTTSSINASALANLFTAIHCSNASMVILLYDWALCFDKEVALVWKSSRRPTAAPLFYILSRYLTILSVLSSLAIQFPMSKLSCQATAWTVSITQIGSRLTFAAFSAARVYALSGRNKWLPALVLLLSGFVSVANLVDLFKNQHTEVLPSPFNCSVVDSASRVEIFIYGIVSSATIIAAASLAVFATWRYTYNLYLMQRRALHASNASTIQIMLYNGSIYFTVLISLNSLQIIFMALTMDQFFYYTVIFANPITSILLCRFILNLRQTVDRDMASESAATFVDSVEFATQPSRESRGRMATLPRFLASLAEPTHMDEGESESEDGIGLVMSHPGTSWPDHP